MTGIVNKFAWSGSRVRHLRDCERLYFWQIYGSWPGWERAAPPETQEAYRLKKLQTRWAWAGDGVHHQIKRVIEGIRQGEKPALPAALETMRKAMRAEWAHSATTKRNYKMPSGFWGLLEHEYGEAITKEEWVRTWERAEGALTWWFESDFRRTVEETPPARWIFLDPERGEKLVSFPLEGVPAFGAPDFAFWNDDGQAEILDWKTGKPKPADVDQVRSYVLLVEHRHKIPPERQLGRLVYLRLQDWQDVDARPEGLATFRARVRDDIALMKSKLQDAEKNVPLPMEEFKQTTNAQRCARCYFRRLCKRDGQYGGPATEEDESP